MTTLPTHSTIPTATAIAAAVIRHARRETATAAGVDRFVAEYADQLAWLRGLDLPPMLRGVPVLAALAAAVLGGAPPRAVEDFVATVRDRTAPPYRDGSSAILWREYAEPRMHEQSPGERYAFTLRRILDFARGQHRERIRRCRRAPARSIRCPACVQMRLALRPAGAAP